MYLPNVFDIGSGGSSGSFVALLLQCKNEGVCVVCGFVGIRSCWCVAVGAGVSVQILGTLSPNRRDGTTVLYGFVGIRSS